jgi:hypothetical protein
MVMDQQTSDVLLKVLIALLGAVAGVLAKTVSDVYRVRVLLPVVLNQVSETASLCSTAFAIGEAKAAAVVCDAAFKGLTELVALGARPIQTWQRGAELLLRTSVQIGLACSSEGALTAGAFDRLRLLGSNLQKWLAEAVPRSTRMHPSAKSIDRAA